MHSSCCIIALICLVGVFLTTASGDRNHDCFVGNRYYRHNQLFSVPNQSHCIKYICWYGRVIRRIEACEVDGECHRVGSTFEFRCTRYRCSKIDRGTFIYYQPEIVSTQCRDFNGQCRRPGERFPFQMHGTYYPSCSCTTDQNTIRYRCISQQYPRLVRGNQGASHGISVGESASSGQRGYQSISGGGEDDSEYSSIAVNAVRVEH